MKDIESAAIGGSLTSEQMIEKATRAILDVLEDPKANRREKLSGGKALIAVAKEKKKFEDSEPTESGRAGAVRLAKQLGIEHAIAPAESGSSEAGDNVFDVAEDESPGAGRISEEAETERSQPNSDSSGEELEPPGEES